MIDIRKKIIRGFAEVVDRHLAGKVWRVVLFGKHGAIMGRSNPFKFTKKKLAWHTPKLVVPIRKTGYLVSLFIVSGKARMDFTKNARWDTQYLNHRSKIEINNLCISTPKIW